MKGAAAVSAWADAMLAGDGEIEVGMTWELQRGWCAYMRTGPTVLLHSPRAMRKLGERFVSDPRCDATLRDLGRHMIDCANVAKAKNDKGVIPDGAVGFIPHAGRA